MQQSKQLAGEASVTDDVRSINTAPAFFYFKTVLNVLGQQKCLIHVDLPRRNSACSEVAVGR